MVEKYNPYLTIKTKYIWIILSIIIIAVIGIIFVISENNSSISYSNDDPYFLNNNYKTNQITDNSPKCQEGYAFCANQCYKCSEGYYLDSNCKCQPNEETKQKIDAINEWDENYKVTLNEDLESINQIKVKYTNIQNSNDLNNFIGELSPRFQIYSTHLNEARTFLNSYGYLIANGDDLRRNVDNHIVQLQTDINILNNAINNYNYQIEQKQAQQDALYNTLKILAGLI